MKEEIFTAPDGKKIVCTLWDDLEQPKAVVQLIHGMNEHVRRYDRFARFLNGHGYIVFGDDHRAHGRTASSSSKIGKPDGDKDLMDSTVRDELAIRDMLAQRYNLPVLLFGHSYGSFISQRVLDISNGYKAACLCGSAKYPWLFLQFARFVTWLGGKLFSPERDMHFVESFSFMRGGDANTRDIKQQELYHADPYRKDSFSYGFFHSMLKNLTKIKRKPPQDMPLLLISGSRDRVGGRGIFIQSLYKAYLKNSMAKLRLIIYKDGRHELLNDVNYEQVQNDVLAFYENTLNMRGELMLEELFEKIKKPATIYKTGGFMPDKAIGESWVGRVGYCKPGESIPLDKDGKAMSPLAMFFTETAPHVPEEIKAFKMISVYISYHGFFDHMVECDFDGYFEVREYTDLSELVPCEHLNEHTKAFPLKPELVDDYPQWDSGDYMPANVLEQFIEWEDEEDEDYLDHVELYPYHKLGGYPYFCQSGHSYADSKYVFQIASDYKAEMNFVDSGNLHFYRNKNGKYKIYIDFY